MGNLFGIKGSPYLSVLFSGGLVLSLILFAPSVVARNCDDGISGRGGYVSEDRDIAAFRSISVDSDNIDGNVDLLLSQGPAQSLRIETEADLMENLTSIVGSQGVLTIRSTECRDPGKTVKIFLTFDNKYIGPCFCLHQVR